MELATQPPIVFDSEPITDEQVRLFRQATLAGAGSEIPSTFATRYRKAEFEWLDRLKVDMRGLLHTDQSFEMLVPLKVGDKPHVSTRITEERERRSMKFFTLLTEIECAGILKIRSLTKFVIRASKVPT